MASDGISRREAGIRLTGLVAAAAGMSVAELRQLLAAAPPPRGPARRPEAGEKAEELARARDELKALKFLLNPTRKVFEAEYGRTTPVARRMIGGRPGQGCRIQFVAPTEPCPKDGPCPRFFCDTQGIVDGTTKAADCGVQTCSENTNNGDICFSRTCDSNTCTLTKCVKLSCEPDSCLGLETCGVHGLPISPASIRLLKDDPFVLELTRKYGVTRPEDLVKRIHAALGQRRAKLNK